MLTLLAVCTSCGGGPPVAPPDPRREPVPIDGETVSDDPSDDPPREPETDAEVAPEAPKAEAPKAKAPKAEAPKAEAPKVPGPVYDLLWSSSGERWNRAVGFAPWGDVISCDTLTLSVHARDTGKVRVTTQLTEAPLENGLGFVDATTLGVVTGKGLYSISFPTKEQKRVLAFESQPDVAAVRGDVVAVGWADGAVKVYRLPDGEVITRVQLKIEPKSVAISADGKLIGVGCSRLEQVVVVEVQGGATRRIGPGGSGRVSTVAFSPDGARLYAHVGGFKAREIDVTTGRVLATHEAGTWVNAAGYVDSNWIVTGGSDGLRLIGPGETRALTSSRNSIEGLAVLEGGAAICAGDRGGTIVCFQAEAGWTSPAPGFDLAALDAPAPKPPARGPRVRRVRSKGELMRTRRAATAPPRFTPLRSEARSFLRKDEASTDPRAYFVRLREAEIGGEFDSAGDEEVNFKIEQGAETRLLHARVLDLPSNALRTFTLDAAFVELRPSKTGFSLGIRILDEDLTEWEEITRTKNPWQVALDAFEDEETSREIGLETITLTEYTLIFPKAVSIPGPNVTVGIVGVARRDAKDDASRAEIERMLGDVARRPDPTTSSQAAELSALLTPLALVVNKAAGRSTHTRLRRLLPPLAAQAHSIAHLAGDVGALSQVEDRLQQLAVLVEAAAGATGDAAQSLLPIAKELATREPPTDRAGLEALQGELLTLAVNLDAEGDRLPDALDRINKALDPLLTTIARAIRGWGKLNDLTRECSKLREKIEAETE